LNGIDVSLSVSAGNNPFLAETKLNQEKACGTMNLSLYKIIRV
jgi:hypothetical protein